MITLTPKAQKEVLRLMESETKPCYLRLSILGSGCSGLSYKLEFCNKINTEDKLSAMDHGLILVDPKSYLFCDGTTIDFSDGLNGSGFTYHNPKAIRSCGCGTSFST